MNDMLCGQGEQGNETSRVVLAREQIILSYATEIDMRKTKRYFIRAWALMVETNLITDRNGRVLKLQADKLESILNAASALRTHGGYVTNAIKDSLQLDRDYQPIWRDVAEQASRENGIPFGREMREDTGGPGPDPIAKPSTSRSPRGDAITPEQLAHQVRARERRKELIEKGVKDDALLQVLEQEGLA